jgi:hypothetical protein
MSLNFYEKKIEHLLLNAHDVVESQIDMKVLSQYPLITWNFISLYPDIGWDYRFVSFNRNITLQIVLDNPTFPWNYDFLSMNKNITFDIVLANPSIPWNPDYVSQNPNISWDIIEANPTYQWNWNIIANSPTLGKCASHFPDIIAVTDPTPSTHSTQGAITVTGGIGTTNNINANGTITSLSGLIHKNNNNGDVLIRSSITEIIPSVFVTGFGTTTNHIFELMSNNTWKIRMNNTDAHNFQSNNRSSFSMISDSRNLENISTANVTTCYNAIKNLRLVNYTWKTSILSQASIDTSKNKLGWLGQEVETEIPDAVTTTFASGYYDCRVLQTDLIYQNMFGCIKKLITDKETLESQVSTLQGQVSTLQGQVSTLQTDLSTAQQDITDIKTYLGI